MFEVLTLALAIVNGAFLARRVVGRRRERARVVRRVKSYCLRAERSRRIAA